MQKWVEGTVVNQKRWTQTLFSLQVEADVAAFEPGQFAKLALAVEGEMIARPVSFVSRENKPGALHGRIPLAIEEGRLEAAAGVALSAKTSQVMICGNPEMVTDTSAALARRGMKKHRRREPGHITVENYW